MAKSAEEKKIAKIIEEQNKLLDAQLEKEKKLAALQEKRTGYMEREVDKASEAVKDAQKRLDLVSEAMLIEGKTAEAREKNRKEQLDILKAQHEEYKIRYKNKKLSAAELSEKTKLYEEAKAVLELSEKELKLYHEKAKAAKELADQEEKRKKAAEGLAKSMQASTGAATGISDAFEHGTGVSDYLAQAAVHGTDLGEAIGGITDGIKKSLKPANIFGSIVKNVATSTADLFTEMDQSLAEFRRETGLSPEFESSITDVRQEMVYLGATTRDIVNQFNMLAAANSAFVFQNARVREGLQKTTAAMAVAYDAEQEFAEAVGFSMTAMAESPKQAEKTAMGLAKFAKDIKASPKEMMADYASLGPRLAAWGKNATKVFKETAAAAKALNIESAALLDIAGQFDTFDEAAEHVGQLNAMLGGDYFDTVEMVNASESERIEMLMEGVRATGKSWDSLGRYERKAIATAAGISDMAEANKMFGQGLDVYKELQSNVNDATMSYNDLSDAAIKNMSIDEKKAALYKSLAISMEPFIDLANVLLGVTQKIAQATGALFPIFAIYVGWALKKAWADGIGAVATATWTAAKTAWTVAMVAGEIALALFNITLGAFWTMLGPVGWAILALVAIVTILVFYWDELSTAASNAIDWLFNAHGAILMLLGPIGWLVLSIRTIGDAWDFVSEAMAGVSWESTEKSILDFVDSTVGYFKDAWQGAAMMWNDFWSELRAPINDFVSGFKKIWNTVLGYIKDAGSWMDSLIVTVGILMGPAGWLIAGAALVYRHWEKIVGVFERIKSAISGVVSKAKEFWDSTGGKLIEWGAGVWNNVTSFVSGDGLASNADGSTNFSGTSLVGERGPEIITTQGANIITNENITRLIETNESVVQAASGVKKAEMKKDESIFDVIAESFGYQPAPAAKTGPQSAAPQAPIEMVFELDGKKIAKMLWEGHYEPMLKPKLQS